VTFLATRLRGKVLGAVDAEIDRQVSLAQEGRFRYACSDPEMPRGAKLAALVEEVGEVARALMELENHVSDLHGVDLQKELVQVAAIACAWIEAEEMPNNRKGKQ